MHRERRTRIRYRTCLGRHLLAMDIFFREKAGMRKTSVSVCCQRQVELWFKQEMLDRRGTRVTRDPKAVNEPYYVEGPGPVAP